MISLLINILEIKKIERGREQISQRLGKVGGRQWIWLQGVVMG